MESNEGPIQGELLPGAAIVGHNMTRAMHANQELLQRAMGVLAANLLARNAEDQEIPLHGKRNVKVALTEAQIAPEVVDALQTMDCHSLDPSCTPSRFTTRLAHPAT